MTSTPDANNRPGVAATETASSQGGPDIGAQDARQGQKTGHMRWVLGISLILAVVAMAGVWIWRPHTPSTTLVADQPKPAASAPGTATSKPGVTPNPTVP